MNCNRCGNVITEGEKFCRKCGNQLENTIPENSKQCKKCKRYVAEDLKFCTYCAMPFDGSEVCTACGGVIPPDNKYCIKCGSRSDGKVECKKCGTLLERNIPFCGNCGEPQSQQVIKPQPVRSSAAATNAGTGEKTDRLIRGGRIKDSKPYKLVKTWVITGFLLIAFICSFFAFPTAKITMKFDGETANISFRHTPVDAIEALFYLGSDEDTIADLQDELMDALDDAEIDKKGKTTNAKVDFNYLKFVAATAGGYSYDAIEIEVLPDVPSIFLLIAQAVIPLVLMVLCLVFFILSLIQSIKATTQNADTDDKKSILRLVAISGLLIACQIIGKLVISGGGDFLSSATTAFAGTITMTAVLNGAGITMLVMALLIITALIVFHYIFTDAEINILKLISTGVSLLLTIFILSCIAATAVNVIIDANAVSIFKNVNMTFSGFWSMLIDWNLLNSESTIGTPFAYAISVISVIVLLVLLVFAILTFCNSLGKAGNPMLRKNGVFSIITTVMSVVLLVLTIVGIAMLNSDLWETVYMIAAWPIMTVILCIMNLVQSFVFARIAKKKALKVNNNY